MVKICTADPLLPSELVKVPASFDAWFLRGVSKKPEARFQSATEMADELHALLGAEGLAAESRPRSSSQQEPQRTERLSVSTQRGPSSPPPREALDAERGPSTPSSRRPAAPSSRPAVASSPSAEAAPSPRPAGAPFTQTSAEPALSTHGAISTEVLRPTSHGGRRARHIALAVLLLVGAGWAIALGPARSLFTRPPPPPASTATAPAPGPAPATRAPSPAPAAPPSAPASAPVPARGEPAPQADKVPAVRAGDAPGSPSAMPTGSGKPPAAARPSKATPKNKKPRPKASPPASAAPAAPAETPPPDPYADRL